MVPPWYQGPDPTKHGLSTNNARLENIGESKLYRPALVQGARCVVICDGFYEWKALPDKAAGKQPYVVYATQPGGVIKNQAAVKAGDVWTEEGGYSGQRPLFMAGLYGKWKPPQQADATKAPVFSYSIITR